ncbi:hypothetical protein IMCC3135_19170 [Granulosicoccus antarcticus IMCC3135]|uniref:Uncharacterized protein n=1 Tax=Granulosicoccus antarcticus IMCC3135 TaxID=1192854 RepID=A0A2Z2NRE5_9GAMM|nr:hypothetical protein IMCC3135_19170 [Granulosicoccus antarcticus IMCC3135]
MLGRNGLGADWGFGCQRDGVLALINGLGMRFIRAINVDSSIKRVNSRFTSHANAVFALLPHMP